VVSPKIVLKNKLSNARKIALLAIGSELRGDDAAGILVARQLDAYCGKANNDRELCIFYGSTAPENFTGEIKKFNPTHLLIIDSADSYKEPGTVSIIAPEEIGGDTFSTHRLPARIIIHYLRNFLSSEVIIVGIQPKSLEFGALPSEEVQKSADFISDAIKEILQSKIM